MSETRKHGDYEPGQGFYDSSLRGWITDPAKLTEVIPAAAPTQSQREQLAAWGKRTFKPNREMEAMMRLRASSLPEERATFQELAFGTRRMVLDEYEKQRQKAIESGDWRPES